MPIKDQAIFAIIDKLADHYHNNINTRFTRKAFISMDIDQATWNHIEALTDKSEYYRLQGYDLEELYDMILSMAKFVYKARKEVQPNLRILLGLGGGSMFGRSSSSSPADKVLLEMAIKNFSANIGVFIDLLNELYFKVVETDKRLAAKQSPMYERIPELKQIGTYLVPD